MTHELHEEEHTDRVTRLAIEDAEAADRLRRVRPAVTEVEEQEAARRLLDRLPASGKTMEVRSGTTCIRIAGDDGRKLLAIHSDGRVEGEVADASEAARVFARGVLANGWGQPRTVTTAEDMAALPRLAVVRTRDRVWQKLGGVMPYYEWQAADGGFALSNDHFAQYAGPAEVVFVPSADTEGTEHV